MRYRKLTEGGDYSFGRGLSDFHIDNREAVAQSVDTRLGLWEGEWFLDETAGTPWTQGILGKNTASLYDFLIRQRITDTLGVVSITSYSSVLDPVTRALSVNASINTIFGEAQITVTLTGGN